MQNQLRCSNCFPRSSVSGHGININSHGSNQQNVALNVASSNAETIQRFIGESSNSTGNRNYFSVRQLLNRDDYDHFQGAGSSNLPQNVDMNETPEGNGVVQNRDWGRGLSLCPFDSGNSRSAINPSGPLVISSGISGYVLQENDDRRISCKRRAPEYIFQELFAGGNSSSGQSSGDHPSEQLALNGLAYLNHGRLNSTGSWNNHLMQAAGYSPQLNSSVVPGSTVVFGQVLNAQQASSAVGQMYVFERNTRLRIENQQDVLPPGQVLNAISEPQVPANATLAAQLPIIQIQNLVQSPQLSQLSNEVTRLEGVLSATSPATHVTDGGSSEHHVTNANVPSNIASSSQNVSGPSVEVPPAPNNSPSGAPAVAVQELLELEAQIGYVNNGLAEPIILDNLGLRTYHSTPSEPEACCICQDDYEEGDEVGKLDCEHEFHFNCITKWLVIKNTCPICKEKGLDVAAH
ncbi:E3 ubiquitin-protein ligase RNF165-like [Carica papaya]|uniref:E3 ubiquitin-protein ligase RNF165-like n=1 Tax=Carica papaya TaxID=3649 RepID=UPI000B8C9C25|nr:E3 ubiquitin-protein ligase RNF165-like [Carica papaya]